MNYKYKIEEREFVFSPEEHGAITSAIENKQQIVFMRGGTVAINTSFIRWVKETDSPTDTQDRERGKVLELPPDRRDQTFSRKLLGSPPRGMSVAVGTNDRRCSGCSQIHFIPDGRERCLPCAMRT